MMQAYPPVPPPPRRSGFPFILCGCLLAFATLCAVLVIGTGAAALAFVTMASAPPSVSSGHQTADLFFVHMAAGRWAEASRLVTPAMAGSVAGIGEDNKAVWGENRGCSSVSTRANMDFEDGALRHTVKSTLQYSLKGTDGVVRKVALRVVNGLITDLSVDGKVLLGGPIYPAGGCTIAPAPVAVKPAPAEDAPEEVAPPKKKSK